MAQLATQAGIDINLRRASKEEQKLYDYFFHAVQTESSSQLIDEFRRLFFENIRFKNDEIDCAIEKIVRLESAEREFNFVVDHCCHIIINFWQKQPQLHSAIVELISLFAHRAASRTKYYRSINKKLKLVSNFTESEQYKKLQRLAKIISPIRTENNDNSIVIGNLIQRYPYLYEHLLLWQDSSKEARETVKQIQARNQRYFEVTFSHYITYKVRLIQIARARQLSTGAGKIIRQINNPILLSEMEINQFLKQFIGKRIGADIYWNSSRKFLEQNRQRSSFKIFKQDLYAYLVSSINPKYGKHQFNAKLSKKLQEISPECDYQPITDLAIARTCTQLINFLVVENSKNINHYLFVDLVTNLGATETIGLLLKLVLLSPQVKSHLEKRLSLLFNHYESSTIKEVPWLVKSLEGLNIAFSVYFGSVDLSVMELI